MLALCFLVFLSTTFFPTNHAVGATSRLLLSFIGADFGIHSLPSLSFFSFHFLFLLHLPLPCLIFLHQVLPVLHPLSTTTLRILAEAGLRLVGHHLMRDSKLADQSTYPSNVVIIITIIIIPSFEGMKKPNLPLTPEAGSCADYPEIRLHCFAVVM